MQKFTRSLTREIEIAGTRLALTLGEEGVSVRIVGTRKPPWEMPWSQVMCHLTDSPDAAAAMEKIKHDKPPTALAKPVAPAATHVAPSHEPPVAQTPYTGAPSTATTDEQC